MSSETYAMLAMALLLCTAYVALLVHIRTYRKLYERLKARGYNDPAYKPAGISLFGYFGCTRQISKVRENLGASILTNDEQLLLDRASTAFRFFLGMIAMLILNGYLLESVSA